MHRILFKIFKARNNNAKIEPQPVSPAQSPSVPAIQSGKPSDDKLLDSLATLSKVSGISVVQHGVRLAVIGQLLVSLLKHLPVSMRSDIATSFRDGIEDLMSLGDDRGLPEQYHSALLDEVNPYLNALR